MSGTVALQSANGEYLTCTSDVIGSSPTLGAAEVFEIREIAGDATGRLTIFAVDHGKYVRFNWGTPKCDVSNPDQSWEQWYLVPRGDSAYGILGAEYSTQYMSIDQSGSPGSSANAGSPDTTFHLILQPAPPPAPPPCGVESCTEAVLAAQAEGTSTPHVRRIMSYPHVYLITAGGAIDLPLGCRIISCGYSETSELSVFWLLPHHFQSRTRYNTGTPQEHRGIGALSELLLSPSAGAA